MENDVMNVGTTETVGLAEAAQECNCYELNDSSERKYPKIVTVGAVIGGCIVLPITCVVLGILWVKNRKKRKELEKQNAELMAQLPKVEPTPVVQAEVVTEAPVTSEAQQ